MLSFPSSLPLQQVCVSVCKTSSVLTMILNPLPSPSFSSLISQREILCFPITSSAFNVAKNVKGFSIVRDVNRGGRLVVLGSKEANDRPGLHVVFEPFEEVKKELLLVPKQPQDSLARQKYSDQCEVAINDQINVEYNVSYVYHAMYAYFDRDNVALKGLAKFFKKSSMEEREHAEKLIEYQNKRGGKVKLLSMLMPLSEFDHKEKSDALYAMELALSLEKLNNEKLLNLHRLASQENDVHLVDFIETKFLTEQVESIKQFSEYVAQLRRVGKGHGSWHFDQMLLNGGVAA